jgi:uncharacterized repeat protein (TIGR01451 family)
MSQRYFLAYLAVFGLAWAGWRSLEAQQLPAMLPPVRPGDGLPAPLPIVRPGQITQIEPLTPSTVRTTDGLSHEELNGAPARVDPAVRVEWTGPGNVRVGQPNDYTLYVRNTSNTAVGDIKVRLNLNTVSLVSANPKPSASDGDLSWELGSIGAREDRSVQVRLVQKEKGNKGISAHVTFSTRASMGIRASEPMLLVKAGGPARCRIGDGTGFEVTVTNPGDGVAEHVKLTAEMPEGMEHVKGRTVNFDIGNLNPGEKRTVQVLCVARAGGDQTCKAFAEADGGLQSNDKLTINVITPQITVESKGPAMRYLDRKATYKITVTNPGDAAAANVQVQDVLPGGFKYVSADSGGRYDQATRTVSWFVGEIGAGQSREMSVDVQAANPGDFVHEVSVQAARGLKASHRQPVKIEGLSAIHLSVVDLQDPVEIGGETIYEVRITNTGTKTETDIKLICEVPDKMQFKGATGPTGYTPIGNVIDFAPLPQLGPRSDAVYRITVKATTAGIANFKSRITSAILVEPVHKEEATRIYSDQ